jgi:ubiquinone/menaquinone biosynthesis C-methylase UbiE
MAFSSIEHDIAGGYQLDALLRGWAPQRAWHRARLDLVAHVLPPAAGSLVLDAASGSGIVAWRFPKANIVSADMRVTACRSVREHTSSARTAAADLCALPFRSGAFSQLYLLEAVEHLSEEDGRRALRELRRVAHTGARFLITTPNYRSPWVPLEQLVDAMHVTPPMANGQHLSRYTSRRLRGFLETTGWRVARLGSFNLVAPLIGMVSRRAGARTIALESRHLRGAGMLLYAVCEAVEPAR